MFKKFIVILTMFFASFVAQAIELSGFYIDTVNPVTGGDTIVHWDDGSETWTKTFQVHIAPYQVLIDEAISGNYDPELTIPNWITPVKNGGATFEGVELYEIWGRRNEVLAASMGNGVDYSFADDNVIFFSSTQSSWDVTLTPVTSVPEPQTYALMLAGIGLMMTIRQKKTGKLSNLSTN